MKNLHLERKHKSGMSVRKGLYQNAPCSTVCGSKKKKPREKECPSKGTWLRSLYIYTVECWVTMAVIKHNETKP